MSLEGRPAGGARIIEGVAGHRVLIARCGDRGSDRARRHRGRVRRQLRRHVGPPVRRAGRGEHPTAGGRALLPDHRGDPGLRATCRCWRTRPVRVLPRRGRWAHARAVRVGVRAVARGRDPGELLLRQAATGLGPDGALPPEGDGAHADVDRAGVRKFFCGPESFTPDLAPIVGEAPELRNYFVAAGLNSIGILTGGGLGRAVAQWIVDGRPDIDVTGINIDRLQPYQRNPSTGRRARSSRSAWCTQRTSRAGPCGPHAARSSRRCTTGWSPRARTSATSAVGGRRLVRPRRRTRGRAAVVGRQTGSLLGAEHRAAREA